jgi:hypothetical protein
MSSINNTEDNKDTALVIDIATKIVAADIENGTRSEFIYNWSPEKVDKLTHAAVQMARSIIKHARN